MEGLCAGTQGGSGSDYIVDEEKAPPAAKGRVFNAECPLHVLKTFFLGKGDLRKGIPEANKVSGGIGERKGLCKHFGEKGGLIELTLFFFSSEKWNGKDPIHLHLTEIFF